MPVTFPTLVPPRAARRRAAALSLGVLAAAAGCARRSAGARAGAAAVVPHPTVPLPTAADAPCCTEAGRRIAAGHRVAGLADRRFTHAELWAALGSVVRPGADAPRVQTVGRSLEGRALRAVTVGAGPTTVLLWSQMHGDESTATMALADLLAWLGDPAARADPVLGPIQARITAALRVVAVPMLNPDGAERYQRENAAGADVNRDARRLATPEGRALAALADSIRPAFAFNLHDQDPRTITGAGGGRRVAVALLAPPAGPDGAYGPTRADARRVAAGMATILAGEVPGRVARYDATYTPDAFGERLQARGTRTVLVEGGALPGDPEKQRLRAVHVVALVSALDAIATGRWRDADPAAYDALPGGGRVRRE